MWQRLRVLRKNSFILSKKKKKHKTRRYKEKAWETRMFVFTPFPYYYYFKLTQITIFDFQSPAQGTFQCCVFIEDRR